MEAIRDSIGLTAAEAGEPKGAVKFCLFVGQEFWVLGAVSSLPEPIKERLSQLSRDANLVAMFIDGYAVAADALTKAHAS